MDRIDVLGWLARGLVAPSLAALYGVVMLGAATQPASAQPASSGVSKTEIRIGHTVAIRDGLGDKAATMIVGTQSYESTDPTVESQIVALKATGADVMISVATPKFAAQSIRKIADLGWSPLHLVIYGSASVTAVMRPAGAHNATGVLSTAFYKDPTNPQFADDAEVKAWQGFMDRYYPDGNKADIFAVVGSMVAHTFVEVLRRCGDDLTRDNVMKQAASLDTRIPLLLPGLTLHTSATDYRPIKELRMIRFDGTSFVTLDDTVR